MEQRTRIFSIKEITNYIKMKIEADQLLRDVWVLGEISNFTHHSSGHMYFTLKDAASKLKCVMFASHNQKLAFRPKEGTKVIARGNFAIFERDGAYQFYVSHMQPEGVGNLFLEYEQLKKRLEFEGLFAQQRKRPLPQLPSGVGVITSPTGAAVRDIITTLQRRYSSMPILLCPAIVQGTEAPLSIVRAIEAMNEQPHIDVLIVGRGGGSLEELWAFNDERVARAIAASRIPVISAVGHETDFTIADFVADLRAATPTAAAELAVPQRRDLQQRVVQCKQRLEMAMMNKLTLAGRSVQRLRQSTVFAHPERYLLQQAERHDRLREQLVTRGRRLVERKRERLVLDTSRLLAVQPRAQVAAERTRLNTIRRTIEASMGTFLQHKQFELISLIRQLDALSPLKVMTRGYSIVYDAHEQNLVKSIHDVQVGDRINVTLMDGQLACLVESTEE